MAFEAINLAFFLFESFGVVNLSDIRQAPEQREELLQHICVQSLDEVFGGHGPVCAYRVLDCP